MDLKKVDYSVPTYNASMKIHHFGFRGKCYKFIENLYLSSKVCVRVDGNYQNHLVLRKMFVKFVPSHQLYLTCSLMIFIINVINMESLLVINIVVEVFLKMTLCYVLQQDLNLSC